MSDIVNVEVNNKMINAVDSVQTTSLRKYLL